MKQLLPLIAVVITLAGLPLAAAESSTVLVRFLDGTTAEGTTSTSALGDIKTDQLLSIQNDVAASPQEKELISTSLSTVVADKGPKPGIAKQVLI